MITHKQLYIGAFLTLAAALFVLFAGFSYTANAEADSMRCITSNVTMAGVGHQASSRILATSTNRAYAMVQQVRTTAGLATSSISLVLNEDLPATLNSGIQLSTTTPIYTFGLNTDNPYTGAVTAISDTGSTTVRVTECLY